MAHLQAAPKYTMAWHVYVSADVASVCCMCSMPCMRAFMDCVCHGMVSQLFVLGNDFPELNSGSVGAIASAETRWLSSTAVQLLQPKGSGGEHIVRIGNVPSGNAALHFTFDAPAIRGTAPDNLAHDGGQSVTIIGKNFGALSSAEPDSSVAAERCVQARWVSDSAILCRTATAVFGARPTVSVTLGEAVSQRHGVFSFDGPSITAVHVPRGSRQLRSDGDHPLRQQLRQFRLLPSLVCAAHPRRAR